MRPDIIQRLVQAGLSEKEARVYAAMLELGPEGAGEIAKHAAVHRATTYLALASLAAQGLATSYDDGNQTVFAAETPRRLADLVERQKSEAEKKREHAHALVPELEALFRSGAQKPVVRFYEGERGLGHLRDYLRTQRASRLDSFIRLNERLSRVAEQDEARRLELSRLTQQRIIYIPDAHVPTPRFHPTDVGSRVHLRFSDRVPFDFDGEIGILDTSAYLATVTPEFHVCIVESEGLARLLRMQFELAWHTASEERKNVKLG
jgi:DNA-binding MarR family transcriptional regulator